MNEKELPQGLVKRHQNITLQHEDPAANMHWRIWRKGCPNRLRRLPADIRTLWRA